MDKKWKELCLAVRIIKYLYRFSSVHSRSEVHSPLIIQIYVADLLFKKKHVFLFICTYKNTELMPFV